MTPLQSLSVFKEQDLWQPIHQVLPSLILLLVSKGSHLSSAVLPYLSFTDNPIKEWLPHDWVMSSTFLVCHISHWKLRYSVTRPISLPYPPISMPFTDIQVIQEHLIPTVYHALIDHATMKPGREIEKIMRIIIGGPVRSLPVIRPIPCLPRLHQLQPSREAVDLCKVYSYHLHA